MNASVNESQNLPVREEWRSLCDVLHIIVSGVAVRNADAAASPKMARERQD